MAEHACVSWPFLVAVVVARAYRAMLITLAAVALVPTLFGLGSQVLRTGSMEPSISVGDVVVAHDVEATDRIDVGRVYVFEDPSTASDRLIIHRIVERRDDGDFTTAGDANEQLDHEPLTREGVRARGIWLVPHVGLPVVWVAERAWVKLGLWLAVTILLFLTASRNITGEPPKWTARRLWREHRAATVVTGTAIVVVAAYVAHPVVVTASFTARASNAGNTWQAGDHVQPYVAAVRADGPLFHWPLDEEGGRFAADLSDNDRAGRYTAVDAYRQAGALPDNFGYSVRLGPSGRIVDDAAAIAAADAFTLELWFRTTTTSGGRLLGFESGRDDASARSDRTVHMTDAGRIAYGAWDAPRRRTVVSPASYNDGQWHHLVVVAGRQGSGQRTTLYVDGAPVADGRTSKVEDYTGWWRVGRGVAPVGTTAPSTAGFEGLVDHVAVYQRELSAGRVAAHYGAA